MLKTEFLRKQLICFGLIFLSELTKSGGPDKYPQFMILRRTIVITQNHLFYHFCTNPRFFPSLLIGNAYDKLSIMVMVVFYTPLAIYSPVKQN